MKLTNEELTVIINEEIQNVVDEGFLDRIKGAAGKLGQKLGFGKKKAAQQPAAQTKAEPTPQQPAAQAKPKLAQKITAGGLDAISTVEVYSKDGKGSISKYRPMSKLIQHIYNQIPPQQFKSTQAFRKFQSDMMGYQKQMKAMLESGAIPNGAKLSISEFLGTIQAMEDKGIQMDKNEERIQIGKIIVDISEKIEVFLLGNANRKKS